jgi:hypothetical protein
MATSRKKKEATVGELLSALERAEKWVRDIRTALKNIDAKQSVPLRNSPVVAAGMCPPPLPAYAKKPRKKKK